MMISDHDTPIAVMFQQPLPRAGRQDPSAAWNDYVCVIPTPDLVRKNLSPSEIGAFAWMAERQKHRLPVTTLLLAEWMREQLWRRWGEDRDHGGEAAQIVHQLEAIGAVKAEPHQAERIAAAVEDWETLSEVMLGRRGPSVYVDEARRIIAAERRAAAEPAAAAPTPPQSAPEPDPEPEPAPAAPPVPRSELHQPDEDGHWRGVWPLPKGGHYPPKGQNVVYLLRAPNELVVYVGSTNQFLARMKAHQGGGKRWTSWECIPCETRDEAYDVESEYMQIHMPHLNVAGPRGGES